MKRSPLRRGRGPRRSSTRRSASTFDSELAQSAEVVRRRSRGRCEVAKPGVCTTWAADGPHHRRMRSQAGDDSPDNLLDVCPPCHRYLHDHPAESYAAGWLIRSGQPIRPLDAQQGTP